jgi:hypothetical protein
MEISSDRLNPFRYAPVLKKMYNRSVNQTNIDIMVFRKTISIPKSRPKRNFIDNIYLRNSPNLKKKPLVIEPIERKPTLVITEPVLGKKPSSQPRCVSVTPKKNPSHNLFLKFEKLALPILIASKNTKKL